MIGIGSGGQGGRLEARRRPLKLGPVAGTRVQVLGGLDGDEQVIVLGQKDVVDGQPVKVMATHQPGSLAASSGAAPMPAPSGAATP